MADKENLDDNCTVICFFLKVHWKSVFSILWPLISCIVFLLGFEIHIRAMYILVLMAGYWVTECIPLYVTGLMPIFLCPLLKVVGTRPICAEYMNATNGLFIVGLMVALSIENCGLHLRIALATMLCLGCSPRKLHFGFSIITMLLSMWLINAAVCAMMCPIIMAVLKELEQNGILNVNEPPDPESAPDEPPTPTKITMGYFFSAPFSANIGGIGTLVGTGTNVAYKGLFEGKYPEGDRIAFVTWIAYNVPGMLLMTLLSWFSLQITCLGMFQPNSKEYKICKMGSERKDVIKAVIKTRLKHLGPISFREIVTACLFCIVVLGWLLRAPVVVPGWAANYEKDYVKDCVFPFAIIALMFLIPASCQWVDFCTRDPTDRPPQNEKGILTWDVFHKKFPWGMIFLIGGGFAVAKAGNDSGMSKYLGKKMKCFEVLPPIFVLVVCTAFASLFTEITSNVAICNILTPILMDMSFAMKVHPVYYTMPTAICCSFTFLMPTGSPTNAIAMGYANIPTLDMIKHGMLTKILTWLCQVILFPTYGRLFFDTSAAPDWLLNNADETTIPT